MRKAIDRSFLTRLLLTSVLPLALVTASVGVRAEIVIVPTAPGSLDGANGANGFLPGQPGGAGGPANADAGFTAPNSDPLNQATATGGNGGAGGNAGSFPGLGIDGGNGGAGGDATATAGTSIVSGPSEADAFSYGGTGGNSGVATDDAGGNAGAGGAASSSAQASAGSGAATAKAVSYGGVGGYAPSYDGNGGDGGAANASSAAMASGSTNASSSAASFGGSGGGGGDVGGSGAAASATSSATSSSGSASSSATATGGAGGFGAEGGRQGGAADATSTASSSGTGSVSSSATATGGNANVYSNAAGGAAGAASTARNASGSVATTAQSPVAYYYDSYNGASALTMAAIGAGSPTSAPLALGQTVSNATLTPGASTLGIGAMSAGSTGFAGAGVAFQATADFTFTATTSEELYLTLIESNSTGSLDPVLPFNMTLQTNADGTVADYTFTSFADAEPFFANHTLDLAAVGPGSQNVDLTFSLYQADAGAGFGFDYVLGGAVPEPSTWALMLVGFAGLGFACYRRAKARAATPA